MKVTYTLSGDEVLGVVKEYLQTRHKVQWWHVEGVRFSMATPDKQIVEAVVDLSRREPSDD